MRNQLELIRDEAIVGVSSSGDEGAIGCFLEIISLSEACLKIMEGVTPKTQNLLSEHT